MFPKFGGFGRGGIVPGASLSERKKCIPRKRFLDIFLRETLFFFGCSCENAHLKKPRPGHLLPLVSPRDAAAAEITDVHKMRRYHLKPQNGQVEVCNLTPRSSEVAALHLPVKWKVCFRVQKARQPHGCMPSIWVTWLERGY